MAQKAALAPETGEIRSPMRNAKAVRACAGHAGCVFAARGVGRPDGVTAAFIGVVRLSAILAAKMWTSFSVNRVESRIILCEVTPAPKKCCSFSLLFIS